MPRKPDWAQPRLSTMDIPAAERPYSRLMRILQLESLLLAAMRENERLTAVLAEAAAALREQGIVL